MMISAAIYGLIIRMYSAFIAVSALFNSKAAHWVKGRMGWKDKLKANRNNFNNPIWVHVSSLGEFEQGRNLIETIKKNYPEKQILLTFYSPSGYELRNNYEYADYIYYLPADTKKNARDFINLTNPSLAVFVKYDYWYHYFHELNNRQVPLVMVSSVFSPGQVFFKWYGAFFRKILSMVTYFFVQDEKSKSLLSAIGINNCNVVPDTRIDRVISLVEEAGKKDFPEVKAFAGDGNVILAGSCYETEENFLIQYTQLHPEVKVIFVPHQVNEKHISDLLSKLPDTTLVWSRMAQQNEKSESRFMVVDIIGVLQYLYRYATLAVIGGGFNKSIHNLLEPATYGIPVLFGPNGHEKFNEAKGLIHNKAAFLFREYKEFESKMNELIKNKEYRAQCGNSSRQYILDNSGGTAKIMNFLESEFLTNT